MEKLGVENLKIAVGGVSSLASVAMNAAKGGFGVEDLKYLYQLATLFPELSKLKAGQVLPEAKDLDVSEIKEIEAVLKSHFDLEDEALEGKIEQIVSVAGKFAGLVPELIAIAESLKKKV